MKILVGIDFSESADNALATAIIWAKKFLAEITLVHAYLPPVADPSVPIGIMEASEINLSQEYEALLERKARIVQEQGVSCKYKVLLSDLKYALHEVHEEIKADLVILGRTTNPDFLDRLVGSTSRHLLNDIQLPLLVIPDSFSPAPVTSMAYATSLEFDETSQLKSVKDIADRFKAKLGFIKVILDDDLDINPDEIFIQSIKAVTGVDKEEIKAEKAKDLKSGLNKFIEERVADLLILTSHKRGWLDGLLAPSRSRQVLSKVDIPVLIYHF